MLRVPSVASIVDTLAPSVVSGPPGGSDVCTDVDASKPPAVAVGATVLRRVCSESHPSRWWRPLLDLDGARPRPGTFSRRNARARLRCHAPSSSVPNRLLIWSDSRGGLWITGWSSGDLFRYDSKTNTWRRWHLPGDRPQPYAAYVDDTDAVWVSDWGLTAFAIVAVRMSALRLSAAMRPSMPSRELTRQTSAAEHRARSSGMTRVG